MSIKLAVFAEIASTISKYEPLTMCVPSSHYKKARSMLPETVRIIELTTDDIWMRDIGPTFVIHDKLRLLGGVDWEFNSWGGNQGGCYSSWELDNLAAQKILEVAGAIRYKCPIIIEGGSIHVDGEGTVITTEECLLNPNRNPELKKRTFSI